MAKWKSNAYSGQLCKLYLQHDLTYERNYSTSPNEWNRTIQLLLELRITFGESLGKWRYIVELGSVELRLNHIMGYTGILTSLQPSDRWQRWSPQRLKGNEQQTHISKYITISIYLIMHIVCVLLKWFFCFEGWSMKDKMCLLHRFSEKQSHLATFASAADGKDWM